MKDAYKGVLAAKWIKEGCLEDQSQMLACGHFIAELDFFEKNKQTILQQFKSANIDDDIYVISHRDELI